MKHYQKKSGFTLIELLVVVLIIGILAAIALPQYQRAVLKSRAAEYLLQGRALLEGIKLHQLANSKLDITTEGLDIEIPSGWRCFENYCIRGNGGNFAFEVNNWYGGKAVLFCISYNPQSSFICEAFGPLHHKSEDGNSWYYIVAE